MKYQYQSEPTIDNRDNDVFDNMVELYYQTQGYITSVGKAFTVYRPKREGEFGCSIRMLAINEEETVIVFPYIDLTHYVKWDKKGNLKMETLKYFDFLFQTTEGYLRKVQSYRWLAKRTIRRTIVLLWPAKQPVVNNNFIKCMKKRGVEVLTGRTITEQLIKYASADNSDFRDSQALQLISMLSRMGFINTDSKPVDISMI